MIQLSTFKIGKSFPFGVGTQTVPFVTTNNRYEYIVKLAALTKLGRVKVGGSRINSVKRNASTPFAQGIQTLNQHKMTSFPAGDREKMREHFMKIAPEHQAKAWNEMWQQKVTPWDRGVPNPALSDTLDSKADLFGGPIKEKNAGDPAHSSRKRALVPGCGKGYDVFLLASYGYDAYGLDTSPLALDAARAFAKDANRDASYPLRDGSEGRGEAKFLLEDFFADDFFSETDGGHFDVIYDYTFLCALPPALRSKWAKRMSQLLSPTGRLICLEFPLTKAPDTGGPPHGLSGELYEQLFKSPGREVQYDQKGYVREDNSGERADDALERVARWQAERTHDVGQGSDHVSIWRHLQK